MKLNDILRQHGAKILTGLGITGFIGTVIWSVNSTPKAIILLEEREREIKKEMDVIPKEWKMPVVEKVKTCWKCYIPTMITGAMSIACFVGALIVNEKRVEAITTAYAFSQAALKKYSDAVIETIGENKEHKVHDTMAKQELEANPVKEDEIISTGKGTTLCYDPITCRYFYHDIDLIRKAEANLNRELYNSMYVSLNDFYYEIGLEPSAIGHDLGWNVADGNIEFHLSSQLADNDMPCLVISFYKLPVSNYRNR